MQYEYNVKATISNSRVPNLGRFDVLHYSGRSLAGAIAGMAMAATEGEKDGIELYAVNLTVDPVEAEHRLDCESLTGGECDCRDGMIFAHPDKNRPALVRFNSEDYDYVLDDCYYYAGHRKVAGRPEWAKVDCSGPRVGVAEFSDGRKSVMCEGHANRRAGNPV